MREGYRREAGSKGSAEPAAACGWRSAFRTRPRPRSPECAYKRARRSRMPRNSRSSRRRSLNSSPTSFSKRKLVVGYILRQHPSWIKFIEIARELGTPLVFRMNLNQQSNGQTWEWHKRLMASFPPIVDCGVHYVDVMCQMTKAKPIRVHAIGARLTEEVPVNNYGMLQVVFDDGSVGWYEAGWGPMMSETAFFVKDVIGPKGCVSIVMAETAGKVKSDDINAHTKTNQILRHYTDMSIPDERIDMSDEPDHDALCEREQRYLLKAIDEDIDLTDHMNDAVKSLKIVIAADKSIHKGQVV